MPGLRVPRGGHREAKPQVGRRYGGTFEFLVDAAAAVRLTRLVTTDTFPPVRRARDAVVRRAGEDSALAELVRCPHCAGFWVALGVLAARRLAPRAWDPAARALALSAASSLAAAAGLTE